MHAYPHHYRASGSADTESNVTLSGEGLPELVTTAPPQFGGPEGYWSPEALLTASVADCFILTFRAIARASKLDWTHIECDVTGTLDRVDRVTRFTRFDLTVDLEVPAGTDREKAEKLLHKSEAMCLITASLNTENHLETQVTGA
jgi:organic hydroperoxide reductase OsmC/OhrA